MAAACTQGAAIKLRRTTCRTDLRFLKQAGPPPIADFKITSYPSMASLEASSCMSRSRCNKFATSRCSCGEQTGADSTLQRRQSISGYQWVVGSLCSQQQQAMLNQQTRVATHPVLERRCWAEQEGQLVHLGAGGDSIASSAAPLCSILSIHLQQTGLAIQLCLPSGQMGLQTPSTSLELTSSMANSRELSAAESLSGSMCRVWSSCMRVGQGQASQAVQCAIRLPWC